MVIIKIRGIFVDVLLGINPYGYAPYANTYRKLIKKLITQCINSIYGTMVASLLCYFNFFTALKANKFNMNSCDPCVANQILNGLQQLIIFNVND